MVNKRVAIVTWVKWHNFGTFLQAYSLQQVIGRMGYDAWILDDSDVVEEGLKGYRGTAGRVKARLASALRNVYRIVIKKKEYILQKQCGRLYDRFSDTFLCIDRSTFPLSDLDDRYDIFVCGSDQIWFPSVNIFSPYYYLSFTSKKKIAYAPSVGVYEYPEEFIPKVKPLLERFDALSVREENGTRLLNSFVQKKIETVVDPTLLLSASDWEHLSASMDEQLPKDYIFCYFLGNNEKYRQAVLEYSRKCGLPLVVFFVESRSYDWCDNRVWAGGPSEFLFAIKNAAMIFTDSFHGTIFSILFEKKFCTLKRFSDTETGSQNSRIENLFRMLGLKDLFLGEADLERIYDWTSIDYESVRPRLQSIRENSLNYLRNSLSD